MFPGGGKGPESAPDSLTTESDPSMMHAMVISLFAKLVPGFLGLALDHTFDQLDMTLIV